MINGNIFGMTAVAEALGVSKTKVKNLWNGYTNKSGQYHEPLLAYNLDRRGQRYSTRAQINDYLRRTYGNGTKLSL